MVVEAHPAADADRVRGGGPPDHRPHHEWRVRVVLPPGRVGVLWMTAATDNVLISIDIAVKTQQHFAMDINGLQISRRSIAGTEETDQ
ncbi:MAG: hypothetical protein U1E27_05625 [Kiritimatiellia bacterium]|nr:hypothetical protein [Kiritimatiellia bacterium]